MAKARVIQGAGFTLIELMITASIIGILASIAIPKFTDLVRKSKEGSTKGSLGALRSAVTIYYSDMDGTYPSDLNSLTINGKYLTNIPQLQLPFYHVDTTIVYAYTSDAVHTDVIAESAAFSELNTMIPGYPTWNIGLFAWSAVFQDASNFGLIWISCTHTDTRGSFWTSY